MRNCPIPFVLLLALAGSLFAQDTRRIRVSASASIDREPKALMISVWMAAKAELPSDAFTKLEDQRRRALAAFNKLEIAKLEVKPQGLTVNTSAGGSNQAIRVFGRAGAAAPEPEVHLREELVLRVEGVSGMERAKLEALASKVLDAARGEELDFDPGGNSRVSGFVSTSMRNGMPPPPTLLSFDYGSDSLAESSAMKKALKLAEKKAKALAKLGRVSLGGILEIDMKTSLPQRGPLGGGGSYDVTLSVSYAIQ